MVLINRVTGKVVTNRGTAGLESKHARTNVKLTCTTQQPNCSFCQKSRADVVKLIQSPDQSAYICDECAVLPDRLVLSSDQSENRSSRLRMFFNRVDCSFCKRRVKPSDLYLSALKTQPRSHICKSCLSVCRQILNDEVRANSWHVRSSHTRTLRS